MKNTGNNLYGLWLVLILVSLNTSAQDKSVSPLDTYKSEPSQWMMHSNTAAALYKQIASFAEELTDQRHNNVSQLKTREDWITYSDSLKKAFINSLSGFKKTPLNAIVTGTIEREDFIAEKIVFESLPGFYVTGCLLIPKIKKQEKLPAVIVPTGHSQAAFRRDVYQNSTLNLVKKGFIVFTFDPIGQGERIQYLDSSTNQSYIGGSTLEHSYAGAQCLLTGNSISDYFIWDGIRAIDFLCSRPEVDTTRTGMTGVSGGGTQTAFVSAFDDRIRAAAPESYITSYYRLFESIGPQDAEQNLYKGLLKGFEHVDLLTMRAPKPTMIISTTQDFFPIQGARETYSQAKEIFSVMGASENIKMMEADGVHGSKKANRQKMYNFFQTELDLPGDTVDHDVDYINEDKLIVTPTGQVVSAYDSKTIFDFNKAKAIHAVKSRRVKNSGELLQQKDFILSKVQELSGYDSTRRVNSVVYTGKVEHKKYKVEKYFIQGKDFNYPVPFVLVRPYTQEKRPLILYLDPIGKEELLKNEEEIIKYIDKGYIILAPDVIGTGELENKAFQGDSYIQGYSFNLFIGANLVGKSIAGMQAGDLDILFKAIRTMTDIDSENITAIVKGEACSAYLHFAVFNKKIGNTILMNPLISFEDVAVTRDYKPQYLWTAVPEAIHYYDLSFLQSLLAPSKLVVVNPVSAKGDVINSGMSENQLKIVKESYASHKMENQLKIILSGDSESPDSFLETVF